MTANTAQRVAVERLPAKWREMARLAACPRAAADILRGCADELEADYAALLLQVAELEKDRDEWKARESFAVSDLQRELRERDAKLAEQAAEIERLNDAVNTAANALYIANNGRAYAERAREEVARPLEEWHEDMGHVTWWKFPVDEPAWIGSPLCDDWPGYHTHFTPHPAIPAAPGVTP